MEQLEKAIQNKEDRKPVGWRQKTKKLGAATLFNLGYDLAKQKEVLG